MDRFEDISRKKESKVKRAASSLSFPSVRNAFLMIVIGIVAGSQIFAPNKRTIQAIVGMALVYVLWNFSAFNALVFIAIMYPFPFGIAIGNSNLVLTVIIFLIFMIRVSAKIERFRSDRAFNLPIIFIMASYLLSFYGLETSAEAYRAAAYHTVNIGGAILLFYLVINFLDSEKKLHTMARVMVITAALAMTFTLIETLFPGRTLVPMWLYTSHKTRLVMKGLRMGGVFHDFELNAEFFALNIPIIFFMLIREKRLALKIVYTTILIFDLAMMFTTITRGAFFTLFFGYSYMAFIFRKDFNFVKFVSLTISAIALIIVLESVVSRYTVSGSLFTRVFATRLEGGIPVNRAPAWTTYFKRGMQSPLIGHGPFWDIDKKEMDIPLYPHSIYLFIFNITGILGLSSFLFFLFRLMKASMIRFKASIMSSPFPDAFSKVLNVVLVMFLFDQIKIEYLRNYIYIYFVWLLFGVIVATKNIILEKEKEQIDADIPLRV
ncbi:MAG: O-antigen ligase family protein [Candidatus Krumholzibacteriota bacterium]|nr:O-antigen ligase family protein [Candidatus Krumholzibacteriota bacterium]